MPVKPLPSRPHLDQLKHEAEDWLEGLAHHDARTCQLWREFHPRFAGASDGEIAAAAPRWSDALFAVARSHGFASWARLKVHVEEPTAATADLPLHHRIADPAFREAVGLLDDGDVEGLARHLKAHRELARQRLAFEGMNYFRNPSLLDFIAENPVRNDCLPPNIVEIARAILDAPGAEAGMDGTLALVASGRVPR